MSISVGDYIGRRRDSAWERKLADDLRELPEGERLDFISNLASANLLVAMVLAGKCLRERRSFVYLLDQALMSADANAIRFWLDTLVPRMGIRRVLARLRERAESHADAVTKAAYWLPKFEEMPGYSHDEVRALLSVQSRIGPPLPSPGKTQA